MLHIQKLRLPGKKSLLTASFCLLLLFGMFGGLGFGGGKVSAATNAAATKKYCQKKMPKNLDSQCTDNTVKRLREAVKDQCKGKAADCVYKRANTLIDQIANAKPKNAKDFKKALDEAVKSALVSTKKPPACKGSSCDSTPTGQGKNCDNKQCDLVALYVNPFINLLSVIVGLVVAASLIAGSIQYITSSGDPQKTGAAKTRITNTLMAFLAYAFMYAFLNFLIPGGIF